eukprot:1638276-Prorocentrum_lima.AAC.1
MLVQEELPAGHLELPLLVFMGVLEVSVAGWRCFPIDILSRMFFSPILSGVWCGCPMVDPVGDVGANID